MFNERVQAAVEYYKTFLDFTLQQELTVKDSQELRAAEETLRAIVLQEGVALIPVSIGGNERTVEEFVREFTVHRNTQ